ncbi:MAG: hypothetical protein DSY86_05825, partial [Marinomonas sp.]
MHSCTFSAILFSLYIIHDTQHILKGSMAPAIGALSLYISVLNLFTDLIIHSFLDLFHLLILRMLFHNPVLIIF